MLALVTGTGRSGTTLVTETLARHPATGFISGVDDKLAPLNLCGRLNHRLYRFAAPRPATMRKLSESRTPLQPERIRVAPSEAYRLFDRHVMAGFSTPSRDLLAEDLTPHLRSRLVEFVAMRERAQDCEVFVQHLTGWPRVGFLHAAFPGLRVVNVVRDGRAVANSWLQMGWWDGWLGPDRWLFGALPDDLREEWQASGRSFAVLSALGWKMLMRAYVDARERMPVEQWLDVRYEDVLAQPRRRFAEILDFLDLDWTEEFEQGFARHKIAAGRTESFRAELDPQQLQAVEQVLAEPLSQWGYDVARDEPS